MELEDVTQAIDRLVGLDPANFGDGDSIDSLFRQLNRLEAFTTLALSRFETSGEWNADGARTAAAWVTARCREPRALARRQVRRGRNLRHLPAVAHSWLDGDISSAHVDAISGVQRPATEVALTRDEEMLVGYAREMTFATFERALAYWEQLADPVGVEDTEEERRSRRDVFLSESFQGMWLGKMTLDPISGVIVSNELRRLEQQLFDIDWAEARERLGRDPEIGDLARTLGQRRADALVEMATRSRTTPPDGGRPSPLFSVFVDYETLHGRICQLAQGSVVSPGSLVPWLEHADIERAVFRLGNRVDISPTSRLFTGATRRSVQLRDRECTHPYCEEPEVDCQIDHIIPWVEGGLTTQENGRVLCGFHNRLRNQRPPPPP